MAAKPTRGDLRAEFRSTGVDLVDASNLDPAYTKERDEKRQDQARTEQVLVGMDNAEALLAGRRGLYGITAARDIQLAQEAREKAASDDALFLLILNGADLAGFIAGELFDDMSDTEISDIVAQVEAKTGKSFEEYARTIIGDEAAARRPGEGIADYNRRILKAVAEEVIDPLTGEIKPEYKDDPVAQIIRNDERYQDIVAKVRDWKSRLDMGESPESIRSELKTETDKAYDNADVTGNSLGKDTLSGTATSSQDGHSDDKVNADKDAAETASVIGDILGSGTEPTDKGALAEAGRKLTADFPKAAEAKPAKIAMEDSPAPNGTPSPGRTV